MLTTVSVHIPKHVPVECGRKHKALFSSLVPWNRVCHWTIKFPFQLGWLTREVVRLLCLCSPVLGTQAYTGLWAFNIGAMVRTQVLRLTYQGLLHNEFPLQPTLKALYSWIISFSLALCKLILFSQLLFLHSLATLKDSFSSNSSQLILTISFSSYYSFIINNIKIQKEFYYESTISCSFWFTWYFAKRFLSLS